MADLADRNLTVSGYFVTLENIGGMSGRQRIYHAVWKCGSRRIGKRRRIMENRGKTFLDSDVLKLIAVVTMLIDHIGAAVIWNLFSVVTAEDYDVLEQVYHIFRNIGRTAFPIFVFLLVEGFFHTHSRKKYFGRLALSALLSEIPYDMAFHGMFPYWEDQNVFWTFCIGFLVIWGMEKLYRVYRDGSDILRRDSERRKKQISGALSRHDWKKMHWYEAESHYEIRYRSGYPVMTAFAVSCFVVIGAAAAHVFEVDYGVYGVLLILLFYLGKHGNVPRIVTCVCGYLLFLWEPYCLGGFLLILFYNGKRKQRGKGFQYFFYLFYPLHLMILGLVRVAFWPG